ncbi:MAG TPA: cytochrome d ubiquinol oxidase subunit II [Gemmatimonadaceae bacterium]|nr:cytochrome d ubiquinol oxidase subunit II [Gemmatimonadaceae bacterium]
MSADLLALPTIVAGVMLLALNAYLLTGGADFGGGVWDALASGPRRDAQRELIAEAIGPIWEANHVWLVLVVVLLFTCFPPVFAALGTVLHIPLTLMLIGIVLRGSAFTFRSYGGAHVPAAGETRESRQWGRVFAVASVITPIILGVCIGALAEERVGGALAALADTRGRADFAAVYLRSWISPFSLAVGALALALVAFLAAVYLTVEAPDDELREDFRRRALAAAVAVFVAAFGTLLLARRAAPLVHHGLLAAPWALALQVVTAVAAITAIAALAARRYRLARLAAMAQVTLILWGWALSQLPYLVPPRLTIAGTAAPAGTLRPVLWALLAGAVILFPSLIYLFRIFKGGEEPAPPPGRVGEPVSR